jgi:hypothetical protein
MFTAAHPIANPATIIGTSTVIAIMAYSPNRVAPGASPVTPNIAIAPSRAFPAYLFISFSSIFAEEITQYDLKR